MTGPITRTVLFLALAGAALAAHAQARPVAVEIAEARTRVLAPEIDAVGTVQARAAADLAAGASGRLEWVAEPGTPVNRGEPVARLDTAELELSRAEQAARLLRAEVNLRSQDRELERLRASGDAISRAQLDQAEAQRDLASADLELAKVSLAQTEERLARSALLAPFVERHLPAVFSILLLMPASMLAFAFVWSALSTRIRRRIPEGWEAALLVPVVLAAGGVWVPDRPLPEPPRRRTASAAGWISCETRRRCDSRGGAVGALPRGDRPPRWRRRHRVDRPLGRNLQSELPPLSRHQAAAVDQPHVRGAFCWQ